VRGSGEPFFRRFFYTLPEFPSTFDDRRCVENSLFLFSSVLFFIISFNRGEIAKVFALLAVVDAENL
jgi:hypothetical protein